MEFINFYITVWVVICKLMLVNGQQCPVTITDTYWDQQWYLENTNGYDMNVKPAWDACFNGTGINVGVVDLGIDDHEDLPIDRHISVSYHLPRLNWWERNVQRKDAKEILRHGTRVAGIIAGRKNDRGVVGIAFGADIADIKIGDKNVFDTFDASLLHHRSDVIDIYSCSFANFHTGTRTYPLLRDQERAFDQGTTWGRSSRGSVYVFASGNSGGEEGNMFRDSCAYDRLITNRYVITVAGVQHNLNKLPTGEECSAMMVAAFTAKPGSGRNRIWTTDIHNDYSNYLDQSSAAAPMVSGAIALALQANPSLTYRDVMHLLVKTSKSHNFNQSLFITNAANLKVSSTFGFGLLDIGDLVQTSRRWRNVPSIQTCTADMEVQLGLPISHNNLVFRMSCNVQYTEHVEVSLNVTHVSAGQTRWVLISPHGTRSTVLPGRGLDQTKNMDLTVLTVQMWGENPNGYWRLEAIPVFGSNLDDGELKSATLKVHGFSCGNSRYSGCLSEAVQAEGRWGEWTEWSSCDCNNRRKRRSRQCYKEMDTDYCNGQNVETKACTDTNCQTTSGVQACRNVPRICMEECSSDSDCSSGSTCCYNGCGHTCSGYAQMPQTTFERRRPGQDEQTSNTTQQPTLEQGISQWSRWSEWSPCSAACGSYGSRTRTRQLCYRDNCSVRDQQSQQCWRECQNNHGSRISQWSRWSEWSPCSAACGSSGDRTRTRQWCNGNNCSGRYQQNQQCRRECLNYPVTQTPVWNSWSEWLSCPSPCTDNSIQIRTRFCSQQSGCNGENFETRNCNCSSSCVDKREDCPYWVRRLGCRERSWEIENCLRSCNRC